MESIDEQYIKIIRCKPLRGSSYIKLPPELRNSAKGLINIRNYDNECFRWHHIRHLKPQQKDLQRIKNAIKNTLKVWIIPMLPFQWHKKNYRKIEIMNNININVFGYEKREPYPVYLSKEKFDGYVKSTVNNKGKRTILCPHQRLK